MPKIFQKVIISIKQKLKIPNTIKSKENTIYILPKKFKNNLSKLNKICINLKKQDIYNIILSKELLENEEVKNIIYQNQINIFDGETLFQYLTYDVTKYILDIKKEEIKNSEIAILTNETNDAKLYMIEKFAKNFKRVNIVTNHINKFKKIEERLYEEDGIMLTISNNKKKSLAKSKYIINYDFVEPILNEYYINPKAIIINIDSKIKKYRKSFNGILVNYYDIEYKKREKEELKKYKIYDEFYTNNIYESEINFKNNFKNIIKQIENQEIEIKQLIGKNGKIDKNEIFNCN